MPPGRDPGAAREARTDPLPAQPMLGPPRSPVRAGRPGSCRRLVKSVVPSPTPPASTRSTSSQRLFPRTAMSAFPLRREVLGAPPGLIAVPGDGCPLAGDRPVERVAEGAGPGGRIDAGSCDSVSQIGGDVTPKTSAAIAAADRSLVDGPAGKSAGDAAFAGAFAFACAVCRTAPVGRRGDRFLSRRSIDWKQRWGRRLARLSVAGNSPGRSARGGGNDADGAFRVTDDSR